MTQGIDWWSVATVCLGGALLSLGGILWRTVNKVLTHTGLFARHIVECEIKDRLLAEHQARNVQHRIEVERRLLLLESAVLLGHKINQIGEIK